MGDGCTKVILNTKGTNADEVEPELVDFLHYVSDSREEILSPESDARLKHLHQTITEIKSSTQTEVVYMKMEERDRIIRDEGMQKGRQEERQEGIRILIETLKDMGQDEETICQKLMDCYGLNADDARNYMDKFCGNPK